MTSAEPTRRPSAVRGAIAAVTLLLLTLAAPASAATEPPPLEDYAAYQPQTTCRSTVQPGTAALARWINVTFAGGTARATLRRCATGGTSEHKDGRAIDWTMSATSAADRRTVARFIAKLREADTVGNLDVRARRMGVMYVIWNDRIWASWRQFQPQPYLSGACPSLDRCSRTLRHRDHVHLSLGRPGARGETSWYAGRLS